MTNEAPLIMPVGNTLLVKIWFWFLLHVKSWKSHEKNDFKSKSNSPCTKWFQTKINSNKWFQINDFKSFDFSSCCNTDYLPADECAIAFPSRAATSGGKRRRRRRQIVPIGPRRRRSLGGRRRRQQATGAPSLLAARLARDVSTLLQDAETNARRQRVEPPVASQAHPPRPADVGRRRETRTGRLGAGERGSAQRCCCIATGIWKSPVEDDTARYFVSIPTIIVPIPNNTVVPWPVHLRCRPTKSPRASLFLQRLPRPASGSLLNCWQPSIFGCWPSGVELPATGGHVSTIFDNLPHSTQDVYCSPSHILTFGLSDILSIRCL